MDSPLSAGIILDLRFGIADRVTHGTSSSRWTPPGKISCLAWFSVLYRVLACLSVSGFALSRGNGGERFGRFEEGDVLFEVLDGLGHGVILEQVDDGVLVIGVEVFEDGVGVWCVHSFNEWLGISGKWQVASGHPARHSGSSRCWSRPNSKAVEDYRSPRPGGVASRRQGQEQD